MGILTKQAILAAMEAGDVVIDPAPTNIGPNSVDLLLGDTLLVYAHPGQGRLVLDPYRTTRTQEIFLDDESAGFILEPGTLYLGHTVERTLTKKHVPYVDGRSSMGRLGLSVHATAGRGDIGFDGQWTLEITVVHPVKIYRNLRIAQLTLHEVVGDIEPYSGRYQGSTGPVAAR